MTDEPPPIVPKHLDWLPVDHGLVIIAYPVAGDPVRLFIPRSWFGPLVKVLTKLIRDHKIKAAK